MDSYIIYNLLEQYLKDNIIIWQIDIYILLMMLHTWIKIE